MELSLPELIWMYLRMQQTDVPLFCVDSTAQSPHPTCSVAQSSVGALPESPSLQCKGIAVWSRHTWYTQSQNPASCKMYMNDLNWNILLIQHTSFIWHNSLQNNLEQMMSRIEWQHHIHNPSTKQIDVMSSLIIWIIMWVIFTWWCWILEVTLHTLTEQHGDPDNPQTWRWPVKKFRKFALHWMTLLENS